MKYAAVLLLLFTTLSLQGCGSGDGASLESTLPNTNPSVPPSGGEGEIGVLGQLVDLGDLVAPEGDHWYFTRAVAINGHGDIIGQSNAGGPVRGAFHWNQANDLLTYLGLHNGEFILTCKDPENPRHLIYSEATGINDNFEIIGNSTTGIGWPKEASEEKRAFIYRNGSFLSLHAALPVFDFSYFASDAVKINEKGEVVLTASKVIPVCEVRKDALYWDGAGNFQILGRVINSNSEAVTINENSQALINSGGTAIFHDLRWDVVETLNHLPGADFTIAVDMNDSLPTGHVIGNSGHGSYRFSGAQTDPRKFMDQTSSRAFFWDGGAMYPIHDFGGGTSMAMDINNLDQVVGSATFPDGSFHAFLWTPEEDKKGSIRDLGTLGGKNSHAVAINEHGQVTGWAETGEIYEEQGVVVPIRHAFLWQDGTMHDLGTHDYFYDYPFSPPFPFSEATAINDNGQVAGNSLTINAHSRGFTLTPVFP